MGIETSKNKIQSIKQSDSTLTINSPSSTDKSSLDIQIKDLERYILVWLDRYIYEDQQNEKIQKRLREHLTYLITFEDTKSCEEYLKTRSNNQKILLIVSGEFGRKLIPNISHISSIVGIYIFCLRPEPYSTWTYIYPQVRDIITKSETLIQKISKDKIHLENIEDSKYIQIFSNSPNSSIIDLQMTSFIFYQLFIEILLSPSYFPLTSSSSSSSELSNILRQAFSNDQQYLDLIEQFQLTYNQENSIQWLTENTPFQRFVNQVLREENLSMLFYLRFFLIDIFNYLKSNQLSSTHVYRKQMMSNIQIENIQKNLNNYLTFKQFLYTSIQPPQFSSDQINDKEYQTVLFEIEAKYQDGTSHFGYLGKNINNQQNFDIIFMCGAIFQINSLTKYSDSIWILTHSPRFKFHRN